ncbi:ParB family chromosome partitioning protein [Streptosporangium becharense]|uniref:ParB family chromosome partitioning protein n=1 Tax=Streptosporangium becharense TaxID=1816182 RepID=A0A7W9IHE4_9ACTN|nr:ParB/RepB/Spo0J family partition protein [Streptosporangium becharense]MBB2912726.1 ParB family chromosome partitioning protein [Streptosporangium becharense]MBB5820445.1 ParB family chromosome partitioning protein [Streptosporangium becharense]
MSKQPRGMGGKGLAALIPTGPPVVRGAAPAATATMVVTESAEPPGLKPVAGAYFLEIPVKDIAPNPRQPREIFDNEALDELAASIREVGLLQPVVVRPVDEGRYELIMGERRWRAAQLAGLSDIPAIVRSTQEDKLLLDALIENLQREQLNALEEAAAYEQLLDDFGATHEQLATRIGRSRSHVTNTLRLLKLPARVQRRVAAGTISAGHARALLRLDDPAAQEHLADRIAAELLSVREVEEIVALGDAKAAAAPAPRAPREKPAEEPALRHLADRLSDRFETRVKVDFGRRKGRIVVEFATIDDLERILSTMAPGTMQEPEG